MTFSDVNINVCRLSRPPPSYPWPLHKRRHSRSSDSNKQCQAKYHHFGLTKHHSITIVASFALEGISLKTAERNYKALPLLEHTERIGSTVLASSTR